MVNNGPSSAPLDPESICLSICLLALKVSFQKSCLMGSGEGGSGLPGSWNGTSTKFSMVRVLRFRVFSRIPEAPSITCWRSSYMEPVTSKTKAREAVEGFGSGFGFELMSLSVWAFWVRTEEPLSTRTTEKIFIHNMTIILTAVHPMQSEGERNSSRTS